MRILFESIHALAQQGMTKSAIARTLGVHRHTVQKYSALDAPPRRKPYIRKRSSLTPYEAYILKRWSDGCRNATQIWKEIVEQGYPGAYRNVARITEYLKKRERTGEPLPDAPAGLSPVQAAGMLVVRPEKRKEEEQLAIEQLKRVHGSIRSSACLLEEFARMLREKEDDCAEKARERLESWMAGAEDSGIPELGAFVVKLRQDLEAVLAAMVLPYSQGQTEGRINKLKLIKRSMYGRGKFDLLRQRVLYAWAA
jgi:transposase